MSKTKRARRRRIKKDEGEVRRRKINCRRPI
jgi:hypothetical protein